MDFYRVSDDFVMISIYCVLALSWNLINGYAGLFSLGHAGFWAVGAYAGAATAIYLPLAFPELSGELLFAAGLIYSALAAGLAGLSLGLPCLRLRGDYLAIATLGFSIIITNVIKNIRALGGAVSFPMGDLKWPEGPIYDLSMRTEHYVFHLIFGLILLSVTILIMRNLKNSSHGRAILSIKDDELASELSGINTVKYKLTVFIIGASLAGMAGFQYATFRTKISPDTFNWTEGVRILLMVVLGGMGSISGTIIAVIILYELPEILRLSNITIFGTSVSQYWALIYALLLVLLMILRPQGMLGSREINLGGIYRFFARGKRAGRGARDDG